MERFSNIRSNVTSYDNSDSESEIRSQTFAGPCNHLPNMGYFTNISSASSFGSGLSDVTSTEPTAAAGFLSSRFCATENFDSQEFPTPSIQSRNTDINFFMDSSDDNTLTSMHTNYRSRFNNCAVGCIRESSNSSQGSTRSRSTLGINIGSPMSATDLCLTGGSQSEDESPVFHSITAINGPDTNNFCLECRYHHRDLSMRTCSCSCHTNDPEYRMPVATATTAYTRNSFTENLMKSSKYESPVKRSWTTTSCSTVAHPSFPALTTPITENCWMAYNNSSVNYFNSSHYDTPSSASSSSRFSRQNLRTSELNPSSPSSTTTLELTGDVRTVDFSSYDQSPLRI